MTTRSLAVVGVGFAALGVALSSPPDAVREARRPAPQRTFAQLPLWFEANRGQASERARFISRTAGSTLLIDAASGEVHLQNREGQRGSVRWRLQGANHGLVTAEQPLTGRVTYLRGSDPNRQQSGIPTSAAVRCAAVYPGVDLLYYGKEGRLEYDFQLQPGAKPEAIRLAFSGGAARIDAPTGDLVLQTPAGEVRHHRPIAYQPAPNGAQTPVEAEFRLASAANGEAEVSFALGEYDPQRELVIDPVLSYSTFLGGADGDNGQKIAVDSTGAAYVVGATVSSNFPATTGAFDETQNFGNDAFVVKIAPDGQSLVYATFIGGQGDDYGTDIALGPDNSAYITGPTKSTDFPTTANAFDRTFNGQTDAFITRLNPAGTALLGSSYYGGSGHENNEEAFFFKLCGAIAVAADGSATIAGKTTSTNLPTRTPAQAAYGGGTTDVFAATFNATCSALTNATYLGGAADEAMFGVDVALANDRIVVTADTQSANFPTTANAFDTSWNGSADAFITALNPGVAGAAGIAYSTFFGGDAVDLPSAIAVDDVGDLYLCGSTNSDNFPLATPFQNTPSADGDAFVAKFDIGNSGASQLRFSSFHGGNTSNETAYDIAVDDQHAVYLVGYTDAADFPIETPIQATAGGAGDTWLTKVTPAGNSLAYSTYLGGSGDDGMFGNGGVAVDSNRNAYVTGQTSSNNFPVVAPLQRTRAGSADAFVAKVCEGGAPPIAPDQLVAAPITFARVRLTWRDRSSDETAFQIERREGPVNGTGPFSLVGSVNAGVTTFTDTGRTAATQYSYRIRVINGCGEATSVSVAATTPQAGKLVVKTKKLTFGAVKIGQSKTKKAKLRNTGAGPVLASLQGLSGTPYTSVAEALIAPGATVSVNVTFTPVDRRNAKATLSVANADVQGSPARIKLSGKGKGRAN